MEKKNCIACGMPMKKTEDFAMDDENKTYCRYCCNDDGTMQSYEKKLESMTHFVAKTNKVDLRSAGKIAKELMSKLPAWSKKA